MDSLSFSHIQKSSHVYIENFCLQPETAVCHDYRSESEQQKNLLNMAQGIYIALLFSIIGDAFCVCISRQLFQGECCVQKMKSICVYMNDVGEVENGAKRSSVIEKFCKG